MVLAPTPAPCLPDAPAAMRLWVWLDTAALWHARLVLPDSRVIEFDSPFLLAQYLGRVAAPAPLMPPAPGLPARPRGLR